jgi:hyperosmotically inducible protein
VASISLAVVLPFAGCEKQGTAEQAGREIDQATQQAGDKAKEAGTAVGEYFDDAAITAKIKGDFMNDSMLKVYEISVTTANGIVTLSGALDDQPSIDRAGEIARLVKGVKSVENNLVVKGAG